MARIGGYRGMGSYGTGGQIGSGATINPSLRGKRQQGTTGISQDESWKRMEALMDKSSAEWAQKSAAAKSAADYVAAVKDGLSDHLQSGSMAKIDAAVKAIKADKTLKAADVKAIAQQAGVIRTQVRGKAGMADAIRAHSQWLTYNRDADVMSARNNMFGSFSPASAEAERAAQTARYVDKVAAAGSAAPKAKATTAKRQAAINTDTKAFDKAPPARMSAKAMQDGTAKAGKSFIPPDPAKIIDARLNTARAQAEIARSTGSKKWQAEGLRHVANAESDLARAAGAKSPPATPPSSTAAKVGRNYRAGMQALGIYSVGVQGANAFQRARDDGASIQAAMVEAGKSAAVPAAMMAANPIARGAGAVSRGAFTVAEAALSQAGVFDSLVMNGAMLKAAGASAGVGIAAKGVEFAAKTVGRVALPAVVGWSAYQGAKEDDNKVRGAARGAVRGLDPTGIFMAKGLGERAFDAAFGAAKPHNVWNTGERPPFMDVFRKEVDRLTAPPSKSLWEKMWNGGPRSQGSTSLTPQQQQQFAKADTGFRQRNAAAADERRAAASENGRGWANPKVQQAAQQARGVQNVTGWATNGDPYDPNKMGTP